MLRASIIYSTPRLAGLKQGPSGFGLWEGQQEGIIVECETFHNRQSLEAHAEALRAQHDQDAVLIFQGVRDEAWANAVAWMGPCESADKAQARLNGNGSVIHDEEDKYFALMLVPYLGGSLHDLRPRGIGTGELGALPQLVRAFFATREGFRLFGHA